MLVDSIVSIYDFPQDHRNPLRQSCKNPRRLSVCFMTSSEQMRQQRADMSRGSPQRRTLSSMKEGQSPQPKQRTWQNTRGGFSNGRRRCCRENKKGARLLQIESRVFENNPFVVWRVPFVSLVPLVSFVLP